MGYMTDPIHNHNPVAKQRAQAKYLSEKLKGERWSIRKLEARTGLSRAVIYSRAWKGSAPLTLADVEVYAGVLGEDPIDLYRELLKLEPIGSRLAPILRPDFGSRPSEKANAEPAIVTDIRTAG